MKPLLYIYKINKYLDALMVSLSDGKINPIEFVQSITKSSILSVRQISFLYLLILYEQTNNYINNNE